MHRHRRGRDRHGYRATPRDVRHAGHRVGGLPPVRKTRLRCNLRLVQIGKGHKPSPGLCLKTESMPRAEMSSGSG